MDSKNKYRQYGVHVCVQYVHIIYYIYIYYILYVHTPALLTDLLKVVVILGASRLMALGPFCADLHFTYWNTLVFHWYHVSCALFNGTATQDSNAEKRAAAALAICELLREGAVQRTCVDYFEMMEEKVVRWDLLF